MSSWPFREPKNTQVFTSAEVVEGGEWIQTVFHSDEDGGWQFFSASGPSEEPVVVSLESIFRRDPSLGKLADLPQGWVAWRDSVQSPWQREEDDEDEDDED